MLISDAMNKKLNDQITAEFSAAHTYLGMSCAFEDMGLKILAQFFMAQSDEERTHAMKIVHYVQEVGGKVLLRTIPEPKSEYKSAKDIVKAALEAEINVTNMINDLVTLADSEKDYASRSFLNWFVDEQVEEVSSMTDLLDLVKMAGDNLLQVEVRVRHMMMAKS